MGLMKYLNPLTPVKWGINEFNEGNSKDADGWDLTKGVFKGIIGIVGGVAYVFVYLIVLHLLLLPFGIDLLGGLNNVINSLFGFNSFYVIPE